MDLTRLYNCFPPWYDGKKFNKNAWNEIIYKYFQIKSKNKPAKRRVFQIYIISTRKQKKFLVRMGLAMTMENVIVMERMAVKTEEMMVNMKKKTVKMEKIMVVRMQKMMVKIEETILMKMEKTMVRMEVTMVRMEVTMVVRMKEMMKMEETVKMEIHFS